MATSGLRENVRVYQLRAVPVSFALNWRGRSSVGTLFWRAWSRYWAKKASGVTGPSPTNGATRGIQSLKGLGAGGGAGAAGPRRSTASTTAAATAAARAVGLLAAASCDASWVFISMSWSTFARKPSRSGRSVFGEDERDRPSIL